MLIPDDPKNVTISVFTDILKNAQSFPFSLVDLAKTASEKNEYVNSYLLGGNHSYEILKIDKNSKLRTIYEKLIENPNIKKVNERPIALQWIGSPSFFDPDPSTASDLPSDISDTSDIQKIKN